MHLDLAVVRRIGARAGAELAAKIEPLFALGSAALVLSAARAELDASMDRVEGVLAAAGIDAEAGAVLRAAARQAFDQSAAREGMH